MAGEDMIEQRPGGPEPLLKGEEPRPPIIQRVTEARSLLTQIVEAQLLPAGRFNPRAIDGEVVSLKSIDESIAILEKQGSDYKVLVYDNRGNLIEINLGLSSQDIAGITTQDFLPGRRDRKGMAAEDMETLLKRFGYLDSEVTNLADIWYQKAVGYKIDNDGDIPKDKVLATPMTISTGDWEIEIAEDHAGKRVFVLQGINGNKMRRQISLEQPGKLISATDRNKISLVRGSLPDDMRIEGRGTFFNITDRNGSVLQTISGTGFTQDPTNPNNLYFINTGRIYHLDLAGIANRTTRPVLEQQINISDPREIEIDPCGNFLIIRSGDDHLYIVDKVTGDIIKTFDDVLGPILVNQQGDILYIGTDRSLKGIQTNFQAIPAGGSESAKKRMEEELRALQERFSTLELEKVARRRGPEISEEGVADTLRQAIARQVDEPLSKTSDPAAIEDIMDRLQGLKADPTNQGYGKVIDEFITKARERLSGIRTTELTSQLEAYGKSLDGVRSVGDTIGLDEQFARLLDLRQKTDITDPNIRRLIEQQLRTIQTRKEAIVGQYQGELLAAIKDSLPAIEQLIKETGSTQELGMFGSSVEAQQFEMMLANVRDPQVRRELRDRLNAVRSEQRTGLEARGRQLEEEQRLRWAQAIEEAREDLTSLQDQIVQLADVREIDRFEKNPLVTAWRAKILALPPELREIEEKKLAVTMGSRKKDIQHRRELGAVGEVGELKFGDTSFPVYKEPPRIWQPRLLPIKGAIPGYADLVFEDEQGRVWHPDPEHKTVVIADMNYEQTARMVERYRKEAEEHFRGLKREVPDYDEHWKITDSKMGELGQIAESFNLQLNNHMGITILEGEAGTGKNVDIDMIANLSNREVVTIACNERTEKEDLTYEFYYDPVRGTYKLPSRLIEALKRPGVIILFDEINTVKPGIVKMLNPLFDYRRKIVVNEGGVEHEIIADPTVILAGTMNPQDYSGVDRLAETILSRADIIEVDYPPFEVPVGGRTRYRSDEAEMLYAYMHGLNGLQQREFKLVWDAVINRDASNGADIYLRGTPGLERDVRRLYDAIRVANRLRQMYKAFQVGESNEPMDFITSIREMVNIALRMNHSADVKQVVKRVILPKIGDRRQRVMVNQTIDALLPA